jgi:hypothetical protein
LLDCYHSSEASAATVRKDLWRTRTWAPEGGGVARSVDESRRCKALKVGGGRCTARAQGGSEWCWSHDPGTAEERRRNARAGGKTRSRRPPDELEQVKRQVRGVIKAVLDGTVDRANGAIVLQGFHVLLRAVELQRRLDGQRELEESVAGLREQLEEVKRNRWAAT